MPSSSKNYAIALHTASPDLGLALSRLAAGESQLLRQQTWALGRDLSTHFHTYLQEFLAPQTWSDLAFLAVAKGPGGFTGTRIGIVTARTIAQQLDIPLFAISTLAAVAWTEWQTLANRQSLMAETTIAVQMPAQRGEVHLGIYAIEFVNAQPLLKPLYPDVVLPQATAEQVLATWSSPYHLIQVESGLGDTAVGLLALAQQEWQQGKRSPWTEALPFYGQSPV